MRPRSWLVYQWNGNLSDLDGIPPESYTVVDGIPVINGTPLNLTDWVMDLLQDFYVLSTISDSIIRDQYTLSAE